MTYLERAGIADSSSRQPYNPRTHEPPIGVLFVLGGLIYSRLCLRGVELCIVNGARLRVYFRSIQKSETKAVSEFTCIERSLSSGSKQFVMISNNFTDSLPTKNGNGLRSQRSNSNPLYWAGIMLKGSFGALLTIRIGMFRSIPCKNFELQCHPAVWLYIDYNVRAVPAISLYVTLWL